jgi:hypothetical protein
MPCPPDCQSQIDDLRQQLKDLKATTERLDQFQALYFASVNANGDIARFNLPEGFTFANSATGEFTLNFAQTRFRDQMSDAIVVAGIVGPGGRPAMITAGNRPSDPANAILFQLWDNSDRPTFAPFRFIILIPRS